MTCRQRTISLNSISNNGDWGVHSGAGCGLSQNVVTANGGAVMSTGGVWAEGPSVIMENLITVNTGRGLRMTDGDSGYGRNLIELNTVDDLDQGTSDALACNAVGGAQCGCPGGPVCP